MVTGNDCDCCGGCIYACDPSLLPSANMTMTFHVDGTFGTFGVDCSSFLGGIDGRSNVLLYGAWAFTDGRKEWHSETIDWTDALCFDIGTTPTFPEGFFALDFQNASTCNCFGIQVPYYPGMYSAVPAEPPFLPFPGNNATTCYPKTPVGTGIQYPVGPYGMSCDPPITSLGFSYLTVLGQGFYGHWEIA